MVILIALISLGGLTTLSVQGGIASTGHDRFRSVALYAAESGAAAGMAFLRVNVNPTTYWSQFVTPNNGAPLVSPPGIAGNGAEPSTASNLFTPEMRAWYQVEIVNNLDDPGFVLGEDQDGRVVLRSTGYGPNGTTARIEWDVRVTGAIVPGSPCPSYAQAGIDAHGAGLNDCMGSVTSDMATYSINNP